MGWTPKEIYGGIHGRDSHALHESLMMIIDDCSAKREDLVGGKIDLRKCFDTIAAEQAIALWEEWGAPSGVTRILQAFYLNHRRWVEYRGRVAQAPLRPFRSLLQGCPASPLLLAGLMSVWAATMKTRAPGVSFGIYLGDRTIWSVGRDRVPVLRNAMRTGREVGKAFGLEEHHGKKELFGNNKRTVAALQNFAKEREGGTAGYTFKMLGVTYTCNDAKKTTLSEKTWEKAHRRCYRIGAAVQNIKGEKEVSAVNGIAKGIMECRLSKAPKTQDLPPQQRHRRMHKG